MNPFDYLATLISIILGLGLTHLLTNVYRLIQGHRRVRFYWLSIVWASLIFLGIVQWWWGLYGQHNNSDWTFFFYVFTLVTPVTLYLTAGLALPALEAGKQLDLRDYYYNNHRYFFSIAAINPFLDAVRNIVQTGMFGSIAQIINLIGALLFISMAVFRNRRYHTIMTILLAGLFFAFVIGTQLKLKSQAME